MSAGAASLAPALAALGRPGMSLGHRAIAPGDEQALMPAELAGFADSLAVVRRRSGAARQVARGLLAAAGLPAGALPRRASGAALWPLGVVGSLAHDEDVAVAVVARASAYASLGIDIEPALPLPQGLPRMVATPGELARYSPDLIASRVLFAVKEAVYKASHPLDGLFLEFHDIEVDLEAGTAATRQGRHLRIAWMRRPRTVALAWLPA